MQPAESLVQWSIHELRFTAEREYPKPFLKQDGPLLRVAFLHAESGARIDVEGFWDGGSTWRVRFAPTRPGTWRWSSSSADPGLDGRRGGLSCVPPTQEQVVRNPNCRGHLKIGPTGRYFTYADGTPFFWLGDTLWSMNTRRCGLGSRSDGPFYVWLAHRRERGFTVVNAQYYRSLAQSNEGGCPFPTNTVDSGEFDDPNPAFFRALDARMQSLWEAGFVVAAHPTWFGKPGDGTTNISIADAARISRYLMARYGAYNIVWSLSGEYQYSYSKMTEHWKTADWNELGAAVQSWNAFGHPLSVHPSGREVGNTPPEWPPGAGQQSSGGEFHDAAWLDHNWLQTGHRLKSLPRIPFRIAENCVREPTKPVVHSEGWYEHMKDRSTGDRCEARHVRWQAWVAYLTGAAGHVYGANAIWRFHDPSDPESRDVRFDETPWWDALQYRGADQLRHVRAFFSSIPWWKLEPRRDWVRVEGAQADAESLTDPHLAAKPGEVCVLYVPEGDASRTIEILHLGEGLWTARWFNPRDGSCTTAGAVRVASGDTWTVPERPDQGDWVLHLAAEKTGV